MEAVSRIVMKGKSGYGPVDEVYSDKVIIDRDSIQYEYKPMIESEVNVTQKWSYKTMSPIFQNLFKEVSEAVEAILNWDKIPFYTDFNVTTFVITYTDKTNSVQNYILPSDDFKECFAIIKQMVPACEYIPVVLLTSEDYKD